MVAVTSIAPYHINEGIQLKAVNSWIDLGLKVYSFNHKKEIEGLNKIYKGVTFIETNRTFEVDYGKPYVGINAIFDWAKENDTDILLINSDIELKIDANLLDVIENQMQSKLIMANRINHDGDYKGEKYTYGIDAFFINKQILNIYPQTRFCLGQCHFDYFIPYLAIINGYESVFLDNDIIYHLNHNAQYSSENWHKTGFHFLLMAGLESNSKFSNNIGRMSTHIYNYIYNASKRIKI